MLVHQVAETREADLFAKATPSEDYGEIPGRAGV